MKTRIFVTSICALALLANVAGIGAQEKRQRTEAMTIEGPGMRRVFDGGPGQLAAGEAQGDNTFVFVSSEMSFDGKLVKGAPYSAQAINESVQVLAGGNRIVRQDASSVYRDSEGRTRRDQTISMVGGYAAAGKPAQTTFINDPVAGFNYILDAKNRTARKMDVVGRIAAETKMAEGMKAKADAMNAEKIAIEKAVASEMKFEVRTGPMGPGGPPPGGAFVITRADSKNTRKEDLGKQTMEGVEVEGLRFVTTIPAGEIGNEQPIEIISEKWYSPELQTVIMSKHTDPRSGENTYRLTNINRTEPAHSLFEVPSDYTIHEGGPPSEMRYKVERDARRPGSN